MLYNAPTGSADPNAPYIGKNTTAGTQGSKIPPAGVEYTQREIVRVITEAGQPPTNSDLTQLLKAIRGGQLTTFTDTSTTPSANAIAIAPTTPHTQLIKGLPFRVWPALANTATAVTLSVGPLVAPLRKRDGSVPAIGDIQAGVPFDVVHDGTYFRILGLTVSDVLALFSSSTSSVTIATSLIENYPSISPARNLVAFTAAGTYTFTVPANVYWIYYQGVGAGGGGAGGGGGATWAAGGGASGGAFYGWLAVTPGQEITIAVGAGGAGAGNGNGATGGTGGTTSIGTIYAIGGSGGIGGTSTCGGGVPGRGYNGQVNLWGANGGDGDPVNANVQGGAGGASIFGGGGRTATQYGSGVVGLAPGSGGGGIWAQGANASQGGPGADGAVFIGF